MGNTRDARPLGNTCPAATQRAAAAKLEKLFRHCQASQQQREQALVSDLLRSTTAPGSAAESRLREQLREPTVNFEAFVAALDTEDAFVRRLFTHIYHNVQTQALLDATVRASSSSEPTPPNTTAAAAAAESSNESGIGSGGPSRNPFTSILRRLRNRTTPLSSVLAGGIDALPYGGSLFDQLSSSNTGNSASNYSSQDHDRDQDSPFSFNYDQDNDEDDDDGSGSDNGRGDSNSPWYIPTSPRYSASSYYTYDGGLSSRGNSASSGSASRLLARDFSGQRPPSSGAATTTAAAPSSALAGAGSNSTRANADVLASRPRFVRRISLGLVPLPTSTSSTQPSSSSSSLLPSAATTINPWLLLRSSSSTSTPPAPASSSPAAAPPPTTVSNAASQRSSLALARLPTAGPSTSAAASSASMDGARFRFTLPSTTPTPSARDTSNPFTSLFSSSSSSAAAPSTPASETTGFTSGSSGGSGSTAPTTTREHRDRPAFSPPSSAASSSGRGEQQQQQEQQQSSLTTTSIAHQFARTIRIRAASLFGSSASPSFAASARADADERRMDPPSGGSESSRGSP